MHNIACDYSKDIINAEKGRLLRLFIKIKIFIFYRVLSTTLFEIFGTTLI